MTWDPDGAVPCELLPDGRLCTLAPFTWTGTRGDAVHVPDGTVTDLASVPALLRSVVPHDGPRIARAAIVHDVLCDALNRWHAAGRPEDGRPAFSAVDTDHVLRLAARELGTGPVLAWVYWAGVRYGALGNPARRDGFWRTVPALAALTPALIVLIGPAAVGSLVSAALLALAEVLAWPVTRCAPHLAALRRRPARLQVPAHAPVFIGPADQVAESRAVWADLEAGGRAL
jgi:hypothetical protein